ncbi:putative nucleotidyl transferase [Pectobacterium phage PP16]|uniref:Nucleotidyl transferase n=1 Tax=Pectobacterium phage PP16 TaxID=1873958 RepID=A0A1B1PEC5_9CAUD|nr:nucleotidyltransferase [Pectobacterium phage PP16]ANT45319.1 putative nucleotidyl transferase [Pectobacterium phage PP16]
MNCVKSLCVSRPVTLNLTSTFCSEVSMTLQDLQAIQDKIRFATGFSFVLAGGCVRDVLYNRQPKDFDAVLCMGGSTYMEAFEVVQGISDRLSRLGYSSRCYQAYGTGVNPDTLEPLDVHADAFHLRYLACMKTNIDGYDVDLLFSTDGTIAEHVSHHDCNVNMVWLDNDNLRGYSGTTLPAERLVFRDNINPKRVQYMTDKLRDYGY